MWHVVFTTGCCASFCGVLIGRKPQGSKRAQRASFCLWTNSKLGDHQRMRQPHVHLPPICQLAYAFPFLSYLSFVEVKVMHIL